SFVAFPVGRNLDLASFAKLLIAVARQLDSARAVHRLHEPGAIDSPFGASAPQIWRAGVPLLRQLGQGDMARLDAQLARQAHRAPRHLAPFTARQLHSSISASQHETRARWQSLTPPRGLDFRAHGARLGALVPILRPVGGAW